MFVFYFVALLAEKERAVAVVFLIQFRKKKKKKKRNQNQMEGVSKTAIAHEVGGIQSDALRFGFQGVRSQIVGAHPLESIYQDAKKSEAEMKRAILSRTYGSAFPLKMDLDSQILSRFQRPPGALPSSMLGYEAFTGSLDDFGFEDYHCINDPCESESYRAVDMHHGMEVRLGLSKGPVHPSFI